MRSRLRTRVQGRGARGSATVLAAVLVAVLVVVLLLVVVVCGAVVDRRRAASAADLAALAGAAAWQAGRDGCGAARSVARRNGAELGSCRVLGEDVLVETVARTPPVLGARLTVRARARAGPGQPRK